VFGGGGAGRGFAGGAGGIDDRPQGGIAMGGSGGHFVVDRTPPPAGSSRAPKADVVIVGPPVYLEAVNAFDESDATEFVVPPVIGADPLPSPIVPD
jgi:hypothetical protein